MWLAMDSSFRENMMVKPSSSLEGVMEFLLPLMMKLPVVM